MLSTTFAVPLALLPTFALFATLWRMAAGSHTA
jgi:hypothetical protein